jgi:signal transduction histidine kinase
LKSNFISNVSHELRTPLTHIRGYLDLMNEGCLGELSSEQTIALDVMLRSEARLEELIEKMIEFSMEASGQFTLLMKPCDLCEVVGPVMKQEKSKAETRPVILSFEVDDGPCMVRIDRDKIQWVVMELVNNAIKFTPPNGHVKVGLNRESEFVLFSVEDSGIGIAPERLLEIFEPYHQLDSSSTRHYGGIGLGLALVKKIVEAHGSKVGVTSEVGRGTHIQFQLPILSEIEKHD